MSWLLMSNIPIFRITLVILPPRPSKVKNFILGFFYLNEIEARFRIEMKIKMTTLYELTFDEQHTHIQDHLGNPASQFPIIYRIKGLLLLM